MRPVDVGVAHDDDLVVAQLGDVELFVADARTDRRDEGFDLGVLEHLVDAGALDVEDLPANREDGLRPRVACLHGRTASGVTLDDEQLALVGIAAGAVLQLVGHARALERGLPSGGLTRLASRHAGARRIDRLVHDLAGLGRVLLEPIGQLLVGGSFDQGTHRDVAELALGLALELWLPQAHRQDGGETLADVLALQVLVFLLEEALGPRVAVDHVGERLAEPFDVHAAFDGVDSVGKECSPSVW